LQFAGPEGTPKTLFITSAEPKETKSTTSYKIAEEFGALGVKVLLIDTDMRRPSLHRLLNADNTIGLSNILTSTVGTEEMPRVLQATHLTNVTFLASGPLVPNPADLLSSHRMADILHVCTKRYDLVVLDGPPVIGLSDAPILARLAEATLMVIAAHQVSKKSAQSALRRLRSTGGHVVGALMSKFAIDRVEYSYAYRYMNDGYYAYGSEAAAEIEDKREDDDGSFAGRPGGAARKMADALLRRLGRARQRDEPTA
jgi:capsular exopolysaccharide synthesis family protein